MITIIEMLGVLGISVLIGLYFSGCMILGLKISNWLSNRRGSGIISSADLE